MARQKPPGSSQNSPAERQKTYTLHKPTSRTKGQLPESHFEYQVKASPSNLLGECQSVDSNLHLWRLLHFALRPGNAKPNQTPKTTNKNVEEHALIMHPGIGSKISIRYKILPAFPKARSTSHLASRVRRLGFISL